VIITDGSGRQWRVHDYQVLAGKSSRLPLGRGARRGFEPLDGGARRSMLMTEADRERGTDPDILLEQLASAPLYFADDPARSFGRPPERVDAVRPDEPNRSR
jgi:hypothetical protein